MLYVGDVVSTIAAHYKTVNPSRIGVQVIADKAMMTRELTDLSGGDIATASAVDAVSAKFSYPLHEIQPNWYPEYEVAKKAEEEAEKARETSKLRIFSKPPVDPSSQKSKASSSSKPVPSVVGTKPVATKNVEKAPDLGPLEEAEDL